MTIIIGNKGNDDCFEIWLLLTEAASFGEKQTALYILVDIASAVIIWCQKKVILILKH